MTCNFGTSDIDNINEVEIEDLEDHCGTHNSYRDNSEDARCLYAGGGNRKTKSYDAAGFDVAAALRDRREARTA